MKRQNRMPSIRTHASTPPAMKKNKKIIQDFLFEKRERGKYNHHLLCMNAMRVNALML